MPSARQAISSSRSASQARPIGSRRRRDDEQVGEQRQRQDQIVEKDDAVDRREFEAEERGEGRLVAGRLEGHAEEGRPRDRR